jgi:hypothetical protein
VSKLRGLGSPGPGGVACVGATLPPPYSPELQPVERVWPLVNEAVANRYFHDLEEMMEVVAERCRVLAQAPRPSGGTPCSTGGLGRRH